VTGRSRPFVDLLRSALSRVLFEHATESKPLADSNAIVRTG
jgi:hypothetical protein